jgi:predicted ATP-grasp superfamily ATP-dependent carboligase
MRILVHEFVSGGGFAGRSLPPSLARQGAAMRDALVEDVARLGVHSVVTTADPRLPPPRTPEVEVVRVGASYERRLHEILRSVEAAWVVAPETGGSLLRISEAALRAGARLLGATPGAIRAASDKAALAVLLERLSIPHPRTLLARPRELGRGARTLGYPLVVKPRLGAGSDGVRLVRTGRSLRARSGGGRLLQCYVPGQAASVALLGDGRRARALSVNSQDLAPNLRYRGGTTPLAHPQAQSAARLAERVAAAIPGLRGFFGVDLVLTDRDAVVIEVNPRLTTAYLGVRASLASNVAGLTLEACRGRLPTIPAAGRCVRWTASGRIENLS